MKLIYMLVVVIVLMSGCIGETDVIRGMDVSVFDIDRNNTNLAPNIAGHPFGTGERIDNVTYWANSTPIDLHVFAHASSVSQTAKTFVYIDDVLVSPRSGRPLGGAEESYRGVDITIPRNSSYRVDFENYHHYEWREYRILSGQNGSVIINNNYANSSSSFNGTLVYGLSELNLTNGLEYKYNGGYIIEHSSGSMVGFATNIDMEGNNITNCANCVNTTIYKTNSIYSADGNIYLFKNGTITTGAIEDLIEAGATNNTTLEINGDYTISRSINISNVSNARIDCRSCNLYLADNVNYSVFIFTDVNDSTISNFHIDANGENNYFDLTIQGGLYFTDSYRNTVSNNHIEIDDFSPDDDGSGIMFDFTSWYNTAINNYISGGRNGIYSYNYNRLVGNYITKGNHTCVFLRRGRGNVVTGNVCENAGSGISTEGSESYNAYSNTISGNTIYNMIGGSGITIFNATGMTVTGNTINGMQYAGVLIQSSSNNTVSGNTISDCSKTSTTNYACIVIQNTTGQLDYSTRNMIIGNNVFTSNVTEFQEYALMINYPTFNKNNTIYLNNLENGSINYFSGLDTNNNFITLDRDFNYYKFDKKFQSSGLSGSGNDYVCVNSAGSFYRSDTVCA